MDEKSIDPKIFTWTVKVGTAIITFMAGILVYMHRKIHDMDKAFSINEERDVSREKTLERVEVKVDTMDGKLNKALDMFRDQQIELNSIESERKELSVLVIEQKDVIENIRKIRKLP